MNIQELLLKAATKEVYNAELAEVLKVYGEDLDTFQLEGKLLLLPQVATSMGYDTSRFRFDDLIPCFSQWMILRNCFCPRFARWASYC